LNESEPVQVFHRLFIYVYAVGDPVFKRGVLGSR